MFKAVCHDSLTVWGLCCSCFAVRLGVAGSEEADLGAAKEANLKIPQVVIKEGEAY